MNALRGKQTNEFLAMIGEAEGSFDELMTYRNDSPVDAARKIWLDRQLAKPEFATDREFRGYAD